MTYIPLETLFDGVLRTLREEVLPALDSKRARTRLYAAMDILNNLRDRATEKPDFAREETASIRRVLLRSADALRAAGEEAEAASLVARVESASGTNEVEARAALRKELDRTLCSVQSLPASLRGELATILAEHLASQCLRDVQPLRPSALREISEG